MAKEEKKEIVTSKVSVKKKVWYRVIAPKLFGQKELGETFLPSPEVAVGRVMKINLRDITGNVKDQNIYIDFKINAVDGSVLRTSVIGYELTSIYVRKMVRKDTNRIDDTFYFKTKNGEKITVKCLVITLYKTQRSLRTEMRRQLQSALDEEIKNNDFSTFINNLVSRKILSEVRKKLYKIYPIKEVALRVVSLKESAESLGTNVSETTEDNSVPSAAGKELGTAVVAAPDKENKGTVPEIDLEEGYEKKAASKTEEIACEEAAKP